MSINPETDLDLEKLFLPAWAQETANKPDRYAHYTGEEGGRERRRERRGDRPPRREGGGPGRRPDSPAQGRRPEGGRRPRREERGSRGQEMSGGPRREIHRETLPLPELVATVIPDEKGVDSMARQVKMTGRAFPLFDIAFLVIQKPERYSVRFATKKNAQGEVAQPLFHCALDDTIWLSEDEAVAHVLQKHFATFYTEDKIATDPPKGVYTFVAQCGMSGEILGPPNYHDYQSKLRKLHLERFSRMPFEAFKSRVRIVRDEAVVKQWVEDQSWKKEYTCINVPEPLKLATREEVEQHFRATHKEALIKAVEAHTVNGMAARSLRGGLGRVIQHLLQEQRRFPMQVATALSQAFARQGLQFFKVNKTVTHVCVARPHFLDIETTPVSAGVKGIVEFINANPKCTRRQLMEALAPASPPDVVLPAESEPKGPSGEAGPEGAPERTVPAAATPAGPAELTAPEQTALIADLHWLIHQGHVIEFANGQMETAKKSIPKPPKPPAPSEKAASETEPKDASAETHPAPTVPEEDSPTPAVGQESSEPGTAEPHQANPSAPAGESSKTD